MAYNTKKHGRADYGKYMQVPQTVLDSMTEGTDELPLGEQRFAELVYSINPTDITLEGATINVDSVGIDSSGEATVIAEQLKVIDIPANALLTNMLDQLLEIKIQNNYSRIVQEVGTDIYIAHAPPGTDSTSSGWRCQKVDVDSNRSWVDTGQFTQIASNDLSLLTYNY